MAASFGNYWTNLAKYGNPNGNSTSKFLQWPAWEPSQQLNMILAVPTTIQQDYANSECMSYDAVPYDVCK